MTRVLTPRNLYDKKHKTFDFTGSWLEIFGNPESHGAWLIWGTDKNGKTWFTLKLAQYLSTLTKVLYVSAEEGTGSAFVETCKRIGIDSNGKLHFLEYTPLEEIEELLKKRAGYKVVIIDNITVFQDELKNGAFRRLLKDYPSVLFVFLAHEERNEPYTATAKLARKLAKVIVYVQGLACIVSGRVPGGSITIDEEKAQLFHGTQILE